MTDLHGCRLGFALCGSFCCARKALTAARACAESGAELLPIVSEHFAETTTRFGSPTTFLEELTLLGDGKIVRSIVDAEPIGPKKMTDALVVAPCTGNTLAKLAAGITDNTVTMAVKSHLRGGKPVILCISTNDGLSVAARNLGDLLNRKHYFFVPFGQDAPLQKPCSLVGDFTRIPETVAAALGGAQLQPILISHICEKP